MTLAEMLACAGIEHPSQLTAEHLVRRISDTQIRLFSQTHTFLKSGELLDDRCTSEFYLRMWHSARADRFKRNDSGDEIVVDRTSSETRYTAIA